MQPRLEPAPQEQDDMIRALLFLYTLDKGLPLEGPFAQATTLETQIGVLAVIAGWPNERAAAALRATVEEGLAQPTGGK